MSYLRTWKTFLNENSFDLITEARIKDVRKKYPFINGVGYVDWFVKELADSNLKVSKYIEWLARTMTISFSDIAADYDIGEELDEDDAIQMEELASEYIQLLRKFDRNQARLPEKEIMKYGDGDDIRSALEAIGPSRSEEDAEIKKDILTVYKNNNIVAAQPRTTRASCYLGRGTRWCISATDSKNYFVDYTTEGHAFVMVRFKDIPEDNPLHNITLTYQMYEVGDPETYTIRSAWDAEDNPSKPEDLLPQALKLSGLSGTDVGDVYDDIVRGGLESVKNNPPNIGDVILSHAKQVIQKEFRDTHNNFGMTKIEAHPSGAALTYEAEFDYWFRPGSQERWPERDEEDTARTFTGLPETPGRVKFADFGEDELKYMREQFCDTFLNLAGFSINEDDISITSQAGGYLPSRSDPVYIMKIRITGQNGGSLKHFKDWLHRKKIDIQTGNHLHALIQAFFHRNRFIKPTPFLKFQSRTAEKFERSLDNFTMGPGYNKMGQENVFFRLYQNKMGKTVRLRWETDNKEYDFPTSRNLDHSEITNMLLQKLMSAHRKLAEDGKTRDDILDVLNSDSFYCKFDTWHGYDHNANTRAIKCSPGVMINWKDGQEEIDKTLRVLKLFDQNLEFFETAFKDTVEEWVRKDKPHWWEAYDSGDPSVRVQNKKSSTAVAALRRQPRPETPGDDVQEDITSYFDELITERSRQTQIYAFYLMLGYRPAKDTDDRMRGLEDIVADIRAVPSVTVVDVRVKNQKISETDYIAGLKIKFIPSIPGVLRSPEDAKVKILQMIRKTKGVIKIFKISAGFEKAEL